MEPPWNKLWIHCRTMSDIHGSGFELRATKSFTLNTRRKNLLHKSFDRPWSFFNKTLHTAYTGLPVFLTALVETYQANFNLFGFISFQNWRTLLSTNKASAIFIIINFAWLRYRINIKCNSLYQLRQTFYCIFLSKFKAFRVFYFSITWD